VMDAAAVAPANFQRWQQAFAASVHPLANVLNHHIRLADLQKASKQADYLYSSSTFDLLNEANQISELRTEFRDSDINVIISLKNILDAFLLRLAGEVRHSSVHVAEKELASMLSGLDATKLKIAERHPPRPAALAPEVVEVCALAAFVVSSSVSTQPKVDFDPFVLALLATAAKYADRVADSVAALPSLDPERFRQMARDDLLIVVAKHLKPDVAGRAIELVRWVEHGADWQPLTDRQPTEAPDYRPDRPIENVRDDMLDFREEARATAELICLQQSGPLAIGLFGDWGSGKSSFLRLLQFEIDELTSAVGRLRANDPDAAGPFIGGAAHVRFDVWQYNDAQLTLALANETFAQLRRDDLRAEVITQLETELKTWDREAGDLHDEISQAEKARDKAVEEIDFADDSRRRALADVRKGTLEQLVQALLAGAAGKASEKDRTKAEELAQDLLRTTDTDEGAARGASIAGFVDDLRVLRNAPVKVWLSAGFLGLAALVIALFITAATAAPALIPLSAALLPAAMPLWQFVRRVTGVLADYRDNVDQTERKHQADREKAEDSFRKAEREIETKQKSLRARRAKIERFGTGKIDDVYGYFLSEGPLVRRLGEEAGLTSRVRRAFRILDDLISDHSQSRAAGPAGPLKHGAAKPLPANSSGLSVPQRVIFYIDELDRCRAEQVVNMLEVVHLLLAFRNFVVVVGVDSRWLESSLRTVFVKELADNRSDGRRITVHNYIEKIFQVPIQIRGLTYMPAAADSDAKGTYVNLIRHLAPSSQGVQENFITSDSQSDSDSVMGGEHILPLEIQITEPPDPRAAAARAELTPAEAAGLLELGPFVKSSPRTVKRFVNVYRLLRALQTGTAFKDFVEGHSERTGGLPLFRPIQLCLAVQCGMQEGAVWRFAYALDRAVATTSRDGKTPSNRTLFKDFLAQWSDTAERTEVLRLLDAVAPGGGEHRASLLRLQEAWRSTARYSFWTSRSQNAADKEAANGDAALESQ
jgi:hypothetical protein